MRTLLSSDAFWKGLGCTGNAWTRRGRLHDDDEWTDFVNLCKGELVKIGDACVTPFRLLMRCMCAVRGKALLRSGRPLNKTLHRWRSCTCTLLF